MQIKKLDSFEALKDAMLNNEKVYGVTVVVQNEMILSDILNFDFLAIDGVAEDVSTMATQQEVIRQLKEDARADAEIIESLDEKIEALENENAKLTQEVTDLRAQLERMKPKEPTADADHGIIEPLYKDGAKVEIGNATDISGMKVTKLKKGDRGNAPTLLDPEKTRIDEEDAVEPWDGEKAKEYYIACGSTNQTAKHFGVSWITCSNRLRAMGVIE